MKLDRYLRTLDISIGKWMELCTDYPLSEEYKTTLAKLIQERTEYVNKIGRKLN